MATCPECGEDLEGLDLRAHAARHWGTKAPDPELYPDANERYKKLLGGG